MWLQLPIIFALAFSPGIDKKAERPFPDMAIFQEWECDSFLTDPEIQHWHNLIVKSSESKMIAPRFYSAIDTVPILINDKAYFRYWPFILKEIDYDSLMVKTPKLDSSLVYLEINGIIQYPYYFIRQEGEKIFFISPYYLNAHKFLLENPYGKEGDEFGYEVTLSEAEERLFWDMSEREIDTSYSEFGIFNGIYIDERTNEEFFVIRNNRRIYEYNICVDEFYVNRNRGIVEIKLYNLVQDRSNDKYSTSRQECNCKLK